MLVKILKTQYGLRNGWLYEAIYSDHSPRQIIIQDRERRPLLTKSRNPIKIDPIDVIIITKDNADG